MTKHRLHTVSRLALAASLLTVTSLGWAQRDRPSKEHSELRAPASPTDPKPTPQAGSKKNAPATGMGTRLKLRPNTAIELDEQPTTDGWWYKLLACAFIVTGAMWLYRRRMTLKPPTDRHTMKILGRTPVGVRSELLIVNIDGQKLLLGVTPGSIQRLATLPDPMDEMVLAPAQPEDKLGGPDHAIPGGTVDPQPEMLGPKSGPAEASPAAEPGFEYFIGKAQQQLSTKRDAANKTRRVRASADDQDRSLKDILSGGRTG
jgi:flagellar protein FliO/FliZ